jgi:hypothetical protein
MLLPVAGSRSWSMNDDDDDDTRRRPRATEKLRALLLTCVAGNEDETT